MTIRELENDGRRWFEIDGQDNNTGVCFVREIYGLTTDGTIIDGDGCPLTLGDTTEIAVKVAIAGMKTVTETTVKPESCRDCSHCTNFEVFSTSIIIECGLLKTRTIAKAIGWIPVKCPLTENWDAIEADQFFCLVVKNNSEGVIGVGPTRQEADRDSEEWYNNDYNRDRYDTKTNYTEANSGDVVEVACSKAVYDYAQKNGNGFDNVVYDIDANRLEMRDDIGVEAEARVGGTLRGGTYLHGVFTYHPNSGSEKVNSRIFTDLKLL